MNPVVKEIVQEVKSRLQPKGGLKHVYFVACGGSKAAIFPGLYLLQSEGISFGATTYTSNEFVHATPKGLDDRCVVILCSLKATAETVEATRRANAAGAITIAMTGSMDTGMAQTGQYVVTYSNGEEQVYSQSNQSHALALGFELLHQLEQWPLYPQAVAAYDQLDTIIAQAKETLHPAACQWANQVKDQPIFYVLASGPNYGVAYSMSCCHLMEMQWKHAVCLHTGEYFHGPFETTDRQLPMVLLMSEGRTRPLDERCLHFLNRYAENFITIDFAQINQGRISPTVAEFFNPVVLIPVERYYVSQMAQLRGHSMDHRRYMWKVDY